MCSGTCAHHKSNLFEQPSVIFIIIIHEIEHPSVALWLFSALDILAMLPDPGKGSVPLLHTSGTQHLVQ